MRTLFYHWSRESLDVAVPKQRGKGFLKVPLGHHHDPAMCDLENELRCNICGLDGYLNLECGGEIACYPEKRSAFVAKALPRIAARFKCEVWEEVGGSRFFSLLGCPQINA